MQVTGRRDFLINIPLDDLLQKDNIDLLSMNSADKSIIVFCKSGLRSSKAVDILSRYDIKSFSLGGGIDSWLNLQST